MMQRPNLQRRILKLKNKRKNAMTDKQKNLITRALTGVVFVAVMVAGFTAPQYMIVLLLSLLV